MSWLQVFLYAVIIIEFVCAVIVGRLLMRVIILFVEALRRRRRSK